MAYSSSTIRQIKEEFSEKRARAARDAEDRKRQVALRIPRIGEIDRELSATAPRIMQAALSGKGWEAEFEKVKARNKALRAEKEALLSASGLPTDFTDIHYQCDICQDTGYSGIEMCVCMRRAMTLLEYEHSGLGYLLEEETFDTFDLSYYAGNDALAMKKNVEILRSFAENFNDQKQPSWLLLGGTGLGKTHLSSAVARVVIDRGFSVSYVTAQELIAAFEKNRYVSPEDRSNHLFESDLLIIDDLGTELTNAFTVASIYQVINARIAAGKATIASTNLTKEELRARYADRITSRLFGEYRPLLFAGRDVRAQKIARASR